MDKKEYIEKRTAEIAEKLMQVFREKGLPALVEMIAKYIAALEYRTRDLK